MPPPCRAPSPTSLLTLWGRDRARGPRLDLEFLVAKQTRGTAQAYGLDDRGLLAPGYEADINVIDFDALAVKPPEVVYDLPGVLPDKAVLSPGQAVGESDLRLELEPGRFFAGSVGLDNYGNFFTGRNELTADLSGIVVRSADAKAAEPKEEPYRAAALRRRPASRGQRPRADRAARAEPRARRSA